MKQFLNTYQLAIVGTIIGAIAGYCYWRYVGCASGSCAITSSPWRMTIVGAIMGGLILDMFRKPKKRE